MLICRICLIHQANYLLDNQIRELETSFIEGGGYSEQLAAARLQARSRPGGGEAPATEHPFKPCPRCGKPMVLRSARKGRHPGSQFLGCPAYPWCNGTLEL